MDAIWHVGLITTDHGTNYAYSRLRLPGFRNPPEDLRVAGVACGYLELSTAAQPFSGSNVNRIRVLSAGRFALRPEPFRRRFEPGPHYRLGVATRQIGARIDVVLTDPEYLANGLPEPINTEVYRVPGWTGLPDSFWRDLKAHFWTWL